MYPKSYPKNSLKSQTLPKIYTENIMKIHKTSPKNHQNKLPKILPENPKVTQKYPNKNTESTVTGS